MRRNHMRKQYILTLTDDKYNRIKEWSVPIGSVIRVKISDSIMVVETEEEVKEKDE